jgi:prepilin signal peptidase PulO-like enzyme (type II secretory pathway)
MIIVILAVVGLCLGSFVNALVWRVHEQAGQAGKRKADKAYAKRLSVATGKSMCPYCHHELSAKDLVPLLSWLSLRGRCRYCGKPISRQYPVVEAATALLFIASYVWWPSDITGTQVAVFVLWLLLLTGLMALLVYDVRWFLLPNRILYPLGALAIVQALLVIIAADNPFTTVLNMVAGVAIGGGLFYVLFQISKGRWIGGGDVKLGWLLGLIAATPGRSVLFIFLASLLGTLVSLPLMKSNRLNRHSLIPFGPFLIAGLVIVQLFGGDILHWYSHTIVRY